jgi:transposase
MPENLTRLEMEVRRLEAVPYLSSSVTALASRLGVSRTTVYRWHHLMRKGGQKALALRKSPGRPSRLTAEELAELKLIYDETPRGGWTARGFGELIESRYGVHYCEEHVGSILHKFGWRGGERKPVKRVPVVRRPESSGATVEAPPPIQVVLSEAERCRELRKIIEAEEKAHAAG